MISLIVVSSVHLIRITPKSCDATNPKKTEHCKTFRYMHPQYNTLHRRERVPNLPPPPPPEIDHSEKIKFPIQYSHLPMCVFLSVSKDFFI